MEWDRWICIIIFIFIHQAKKKRCHILMKAYTYTYIEEIVLQNNSSCIINYIGIIMVVQIFKFVRIYQFYTRILFLAWKIDLFYRRCILLIIFNICDNMQSVKICSYIIDPNIFFMQWEWYGTKHVILKSGW